MVDPKGIEPSNLTDANRALSQLSYGPILFAALQRKLLYHLFWNCKEQFLKMRNFSCQAENDIVE